MESKKLTVELPANIHTELKITATEQGVSMKDILLECVERVIAEHKKKKQDK